MSYNPAHDSRRLVYLPNWARLLTMTASLIGLAVSLGIAIAFTLRQNDGDKVVLAMSVAQIALGGLLFIVVLFFSQRDENVETLRLRSDAFLDTHVVNALRRVSVPDAGIDRLYVESLGRKDIFGFQYHLAAGETFTYTMWIGLNVNRIFVIYFLPTKGSPDAYLRKLKTIFQFTFGGAEAVSYKATYEHAVIDGESIVSIWLTAPTDRELLTDPAEKLFWAQDVAMMTASFLRTAHRSGVDLKTRALARPL